MAVPIQALRLLRRLAVEFDNILFNLVQFEHICRDLSKRVVSRQMRLGPARQGFRTAPGPKGSTAKEITLGAAGVPDLIYVLITLFLGCALVDMSPRSRVRSNASFRRGVNPLVVLVILIAGFGVVIGTGFYLLTAQTVTVVLDGVPQTVRTHQPTVDTLLAELQLPIGPKDVVAPPGETAIHNGLTVTVSKAHAVIVEVDGGQQRVLTQAIQPRDILSEAGVTVGPHDAVLVDNTDLKQEPYSAPPRYILVTRALAVRLDDNGTTSTIYTTHRTVGEALYDAKQSLYLADQIIPDPSAPLTDDTVITVWRSVPVTVQVDGRTLVTRTHGKTVNDALAEIGIALVGLDFAIPDGSAPLQPGMTIQVVRVTEDNIIIQQTPLDFKHLSKPDPTLPLDTRQVIQKGIPGVVEQQVHVRREDGVEVSRSAVESVVTQAPRDEITAVGTLATLKALDTPDGPIQYWRVFTMRAVSYKPSSAGRDSSDPQYGLTASGQKLRKGLVAVDPQVIPLGTRLYVPGYGMAIASDTGGGVQGLVIDLGYSDDDYQDWSGTVQVYLLPPVPPPDQIPILPEEN